MSHMAQLHQQPAVQCIYDWQAARFYMSVLDKSATSHIAVLLASI